MYRVRLFDLERLYAFSTITDKEIDSNNTIHRSGGGLWWIFTEPRRSQVIK